jgi:hypothetical protein
MHLPIEKLGGRAQREHLRRRHGDSRDHVPRGVHQVQTPMSPQRLPGRRDPITGVPVIRPGGTSCWARRSIYTG